jgi:hypothetical protein
VSMASGRCIRFRVAQRILALPWLCICDEESSARSERPRAEQWNGDRATRRAEEEGGDMLLVTERRRSRRAPKARSARSEHQRAEQ